MEFSPWTKTSRTNFQTRKRHLFDNRWSRKNEVSRVHKKAPKAHWYSSHHPNAVLPEEKRRVVPFWTMQEKIHALCNLLHSLSTRTAGHSLPECKIKGHFGREREKVRTANWQAYGQRLIGIAMKDCMQVRPSI